MAIDPRGFRQALIARQMKLAPEVPEPIDPALLASLSQNPPNPDMPIDELQGMPEEGPEPGPDAAMDAGFMQPNLPPELMIEADKLKIKEMLKRTRMQELEQEANVMREARMADIEREANDLFAPQKSKKGY